MAYSDIIPVQTSLSSLTGVKAAVTTDGGVLLAKELVAGFEDFGGGDGVWNYASFPSDRNSVIHFYTGTLATLVGAQINLSGIVRVGGGISIVPASGSGGAGGTVNVRVEATEMRVSNE